jgi:argininosuccinate lyase
MQHLEQRRRCAVIHREALQSILTTHQSMNSVTVIRERIRQNVTTEYHNTTVNEHPYVETNLKWLIAHEAVTRLMLKLIGRLSCQKGKPRK